ncbi:head decoration protein [Ottowia testudinis]|uniref:Head decoration protein n=1 Tax=Ottowia testudinis TaxID=2816950 RepID=A0A975CHF9_9BURK|nr:head decoration protein [Ottowia testudinis]QTD44977.1 head decoration protein [Ottowia testudinis]
MPEITESLNLGDLLKYEAPNLYSRERVTVLAGQHLVLGTVVGVVTATGKCRALDPAATDGSQIAAGVLLQDCNASLAERDDGLMVARHAIVAHHALTWPKDITTEAKAAAMAQLKALGVLVRQAV